MTPNKNRIQCMFNHKESLPHIWHPGLVAIDDKKSSLMFYHISHHAWRLWKLIAILSFWPTLSWPLLIQTSTFHCPGQPEDLSCLVPHFLFIVTIPNIPVPTSPPHPSSNLPSPSVDPSKFSVCTQYIELFLHMYLWSWLFCYDFFFKFWWLIIPVTLPTQIKSVRVMWR